MSTLQECTTAILALHDLTKGFGTGSTPDPSSVLGYQSTLVRLHMELGQDIAKRFGTKEVAYLTRKLAEANSYKKGRIEFKKTASDSNHDAFLSVQTEFYAEIDSATLYESYRQMIRSLQNSIEHSRQVVSFVRNAETNAQ